MFEAQRELAGLITQHKFTLVGGDPDCMYLWARESSGTSEEIEERSHDLISEITEFNKKYGTQVPSHCEVSIVPDEQIDHYIELIHAALN